MHATILNGALDGDRFVDAVRDVLFADLSEHGWQVTCWQLRDCQIACCLGCFQCWTKTPGLCRIADDGHAVTASIIRSDLTVYLTPITFGGYSSELKKALDRSICLVSPFFLRVQGEVHHHPRYDRFPNLVAVGVLPAPDYEEETVFRRLVERNAINMHARAETHVVYRSQSAEDLRLALAKIARNGRIPA